MINKVFIVNNFIKLQLEGEETVIYVGNRQFTQCNFLLLNIPIERMTSIGEIESIDEISEKLDKTLEINQIKLSPDVEFWGHSSNLQFWAERGYDSRLLHSNLAFPLLNELVKFGDFQAINVFKDEIFKRFSSGFSPTQEFLIENRYLDYLTSEEKEILFKSASIDKNIRILTRNYKGDINLFIFCSNNNPKFANAISYISLNQYGLRVYYGCIFIDEEIFGFKIVLQDNKINHFYIIYEGNRMYIDQDSDHIYALEVNRFLRSRSLDYFFLDRCEKVLTNYFKLSPTEDKYVGYYQLDFDIVDSTFQSFFDKSGNKNFFLKTDRFNLDIIKYLRQSKYFRKNYFNIKYGENLSIVLKYLESFG